MYSVSIYDALMIEDIEDKIEKYDRSNLTVACSQALPDGHA